jgi:hypothetical protein
MVESGEGISKVDSPGIRTGRQRKEWWRVVRGAANLTVQIFRTWRQGKEWWRVVRGAAILTVQL